MSVRANASNEGLLRTTSVPSPTSFTIAGWINRRGAVTATSFGSITSMLNATLAAGTGMSILNGTTTVRIGNGTENVSLGVDLALDTWYYFAVGCNGTASDSFTGWIIEEDLTVHTISITGISFTPASIRLLNISEAALWLDASIANVMVWDSKLTTAQLLAQMVTSNPQVTPHLWTPLNLHTNLNDISGNNRHWSSVGGALSTEANPTIPYLTNVDLVSFTSTPNAITVTENEIVLLDLVTFSSTTNDISVIDNENTELDLVAFSSTISDIVVTENEIISLDSVSFSGTIYDISVLENELISLETTSYTIVVNDLSVTENELVPLDLVSYSVAFDDINVLENELVSFDLVEFSTTMFDVDLLEESDISLDLVSYSGEINDIEVTFQETDQLDLVVYSLATHDVFVTEQEIEALEPVVYSSQIYDLTLDEGAEIVLDLVSYSVIVNQVFFAVDFVRPPTERIYSIAFEDRVFSIEEEDRTFAIDLEERIFAIN